MFLNSKIPNIRICEGFDLDKYNDYRFCHEMRRNVIKPIFFLLKYFRNVEEIEWAIELALEYGKPVAATMCMGPKGDAAGVPVAECAVRMAKAGANLVTRGFFY